MFEKVNPSHPDKVADRIAGAIVDLCYTKSRNRWSNDAKLDLSTAEGRQRWAQANPKVACEVLIGHGECNIQVETSEQITWEECHYIVRRIAGDGIVDYSLIVPQDIHLAANQQHGVRCGDNGIFRGVPPTHEQKLLTAIAASIYDRHPFDGKYIINRHHPEPTKSLLPDNLQEEYDYIREKHKEILEGKRAIDAVALEQNRKFNEEEFKAWSRMTKIDKSLEKRNEALKKIAIEEAQKRWEYSVTICQSHLSREQEPELREHLKNAYGIHLPIINPLGEWTGGPNTDSGATNRKLGSDMGDGVSGGGINGKDLSKGDVSINIVCYLKAVQSGQTVTACCSIGDEQVTFQYASGKTETETFADVVEMARLYILTDCNGSFEEFAKWGLIRPIASE